jgi:membrane-bound lytic murein transglycosylase F
LQKSTSQSFLKGAAKALIGAVLLLFLYSGDDRPNHLEQVMQRGSLTMLTRNGASSYYLGADGPTGPEYALVREFADFLGVKLDIEVAAAFNQLSGLLGRREGDLIAANLARTPEREPLFNFGPDYQETATMVVYRRGQRRPRSMEDLQGLKIMVIAGSSYEEALGHGVAAAGRFRPGHRRHACGFEHIQSERALLPAGRRRLHPGRNPAAGLGFCAGTR